MEHNNNEYTLFKRPSFYCRCDGNDISSNFISTVGGFWWTFEDTLTGPFAESVSGNSSYSYVTSSDGINGTQKTIANGKVGKALELKAESGPYATNINMQSSSVNMIYTDGFTFTTWIRPTGSMPTTVEFRYRTYDGVFLVGFEAPPAVSAEIFWTWAANNWTAYLYDSGSNQLMTDTIPFVPVVGTWYFMRFSYDKVAGKFIYQVNNGTETSSISTVSYSPTTAVSALLTLRIDGPGGVLDIDELNFYDYVLSPAEVTTLWNSGNGQTYP